MKAGELTIKVRVCLSYLRKAILQWLAGKREVVKLLFYFILFYLIYLFLGGSLASDQPFSNDEMKDI